MTYNVLMGTLNPAHSPHKQSNSCRRPSNKSRMVVATTGLPRDMQAHNDHVAVYTRTSRPTLASQQNDVQHRYTPSRTLCLLGRSCEPSCRFHVSRGTGFPPSAAHSSATSSPRTTCMSLAGRRINRCPGAVPPPTSALPTHTHAHITVTRNSS